MFDKPTETIQTTAGAKVRALNLISFLFQFLNAPQMPARNFPVF